MCHHSFTAAEPHRPLTVIHSAIRVAAKTWRYEQQLYKRMKNNKTINRDVASSASPDA
jgi:hypothetical protein